MGRAIDMEKDIDVLKRKLEKLENTVRGMVSKLDELDEKGTKTKHVDLTEVKNEKEDEQKFVERTQHSSLYEAGVNCAAFGNFY